MADPVKLTVRSDLLKILGEMEQLQKKAKDITSGLTQAGTEVADGLADNAKKTEGYLGKLRGFGRRVADQLRSDFKSLISLNALQESLKLSNQFRNAVTQAVELNDVVRRLGPTFGKTERDFARFQAKLVEGLGEVGLSSQVAASTLQGLANTPVRNEQAIVGYGRKAGQLASISGTRGSEGDIAGLLARTLRAQGKDPNDTKALDRLAEDVRKVFVATGASPQQTLQNMEQLFERMPKELRNAFSSEAMVNLAAASNVAGPSGAKFIEEFLTSGPLQNLAFRAQGGGKAFTKDGLNLDALQRLAGAAGRIGFDARAGAQTLGISEEAAEGLIRLAQSLDRVKAAQEAARKTTGSLEEQYKRSRGPLEAFQSVLSQTAATVAAPLAKGTQAVTGLMNDAANSKAGSIAVAVGGGVLASLLAGAGLRGIGKGIAGGVGGTLARGAAAEAITGQKTIPVYVTNASEIGGGLGGLGAGGAAGAGAMLAKLGPLAAGLAALGAGAAAGYGLNKLMEKHTQGETSEGFKGDAMSRLIFNMQKFFDTEGYRSFKEAQELKIIVENRAKELRATPQPSRGARY